MHKFFLWQSFMIISCMDNFEEKKFFPLLSAIMKPFSSTTDLCVCMKEICKKAKRREKKKTSSYKNIFLIRNMFYTFLFQFLSLFTWCIHSIHKNIRKKNIVVEGKNKKLFQNFKQLQFSEEKKKTLGYFHEKKQNNFFLLLLYMRLCIDNGINDPLWLFISTEIIIAQCKHV